MKSSAVFLSLFGLFWTGIVGAFDGFVGYAIVKQLVATRYPAVTGRVTHSEVTRHRGSKGGATYGVRIEYTYFVGDEEFHGDRFRYGLGSSSDSEWAHAAVRAHPDGRETRVYYNPEHPEESLLRPGVDGSDFMLLLFLTPFNAMMLGLWAAAGSALWFRLRQPPAGGVRMRRNLRETKVCLAEFGPLAAGLGAGGISGFLAIFVVGFGFGGFHPRLPVVLTVWAVVLAIGLTAAVVQWGRIRSGRHDLVLDDLNGMLELPATRATAVPARVPFAGVESVRVEVVTQRGRKGGTTVTYVPTLRLRPGQGADAALGKFYERKRADAFAEWLREQLRLPPTAA